MSESPAQPRVCLIADEVVLGEARDWVRALAGGLARAGAEVDVLVPEPFLDGFPAPEGNVQLWKWPSAVPIVRRREFDELLERITEPGVPVLHALSRFSAPLADRLAEATGTRFVVTCHRPSGDLGRGVAHHLQRVAGVVAAGTRVAEAVRRRYRLGEQQVLLLRTGVSVAKSVACFSRPSNTPVVALAARPRNREAVRSALTAVRTLLDEGIEFHILLMAGSVEQRSLRARVNELGLRGLLTVYDSSLPLAQVLGSGDVFVQPYPQRRPSVDLLTAMGCGLAPIVLGDTPYDKLLDGENVLLLEGGSPEEIADRLRAAFADHRATRRLAHNAQETVAALHTQRRELQGTLAAYESLLGRDRTFTLPQPADG